MRATTNEPKKIIISWEPSVTQDVSYYKIYRTSTKFLPYSYLVKTQATVYEDLINANGKEYYYKVTAVDKDELESMRQDEPVMGATLTAPEAPAYISAIPEGGSINVSWSSSPRANSYTLYRTGGSDAVISDIAGTNYTDANVQAGVQYSYEVVAVDQFGISSSKSSKAQAQIK